MRFFRRSLNNLIQVNRSDAVTWHGAPIATWQAFHKRVSSRQADLLRALPQFTNPVFVAGCQRSGTTMLARILARSDCMQPFAFGHDEELDAALILSGMVSLPSEGRFCFQTTYLDGHYTNYFPYKGQYKLLWVVRDPFAVVHSMVHSWARFALNILYASCAADLAPRKKRLRSLLLPFGLTRLERAAYAYVGKNRQVFELQNVLSRDELRIVAYNDLVSDPATHLPRIYEWLGIDYKDAYVEGISSRSLHKGDALSARDKAFVEALCGPIHGRLLESDYLL